MDKVFEMYNNLKPLWDRPAIPADCYELTNIRSIANRGVGVEIEVEGLHNGAPKFDGNLWIVKGDNSLRDNGVEFVTRYGMRVGHVNDALKVFEKNLKKMPHSFSPRTSVHVHLDVRYFPFERLENLLVVYTVFEEALFRFAGGDRSSNIFCIPLRNTPYIAAPMQGNMMNQLHRWEKYSAINFTPIMKFGSVEFRHMPGTCDATKLWQWVLLLSSLVQWARDNRREVVQDRIMKIKNNSQYRHLMDDVFGNLAQFLVATPNELDASLSDAKQFFNFAKEVN